MTRSTPARPRPQELGRAAAAAVALVLVIAAAATAYLLTRRAAAPLTGLVATAARMAPESTQVFAAVDLAKMGVGAVSGKDVVDAFRQLEGMDKLDKELRQELGVSLEDLLASIEPAGVVALAPLEGKTSLFDPRARPAGGRPPFRGFVALQLKDEAKTAETLSRIQQKSGVKEKTEAYGGATIHEPEVTDKGPSWTIHQKHLIGGVSSQDVKAALDGLAGKGRSLADSSRFREALAKLKHTEALVAYVDLQGMLSAAPLDQPDVPNELKQFVRGLRVLVGGMGLDGKDLVSEFLFAVDPKEGGPIVGDVFKPAYGMDMKTLDLFPADTEAYGALNVKMFWQMAYDILGRFPQGRQVRDLPASQLKMQGIDLKTDILDALSGEVGYVMPSYGRFAASSMRMPGDDAPPNPFEMFEQLQVVVAVPLLQKDKFKSLLDRTIPESARETLTRTDHQGTPIYSAPGDRFAYAFVDDNLVVAIKDGPEQIKKLIDGRKAGGSIRTRPGYDRALALAGGAKPIVVGYADAKKVYGGMADALEARQPGMAKLIRLAAKAESVWQVWVLRPDGLYGVSLTTVLAGSGANP